MIVAQAGRPGAVTIATNMAGRGTDIVLGGNLEAELHGMGDGRRRRPRRRVRAEWKAASRRGAGRRRPAHRRHRTPRVPPYRQPAARPFRPPGRRGLEPLLSFARRQPDAHLRRSRARQALAADRRHEGRRGDREPHAHEPDRDARSARSKPTTSTPARTCSTYDDVANDQRKVIYHQRTELMAAEEVGEAIAGIRARSRSTRLIDPLRAAGQLGRAVGRRRP